MTAPPSLLPVSDAQQAARATERSFFGHPRGLGPLAVSGAFERFAYYGMQSLLVLWRCCRC
jgi:POT family proton-dependent oligopeptide transporter